MDEATYIYRINSVCLKKGEPFTPGRINVFVGANNCGKTQLLKDMGQKGVIKVEGRGRGTKYVIK